MIDLENIILNTDSYKISHWAQYPPKTQHVYSYLEARAGDVAPWTVFFGLQYLLKKHLVGAVLSMEMIDQAEAVLTAHLGPNIFNRAAWVRLLEKHNGRLPLVIKAVPEGSVIPVRNVLMTVENTDPEFPWLTNYVETLLVQTWYPSTVATRSRLCKQLIRQNLERSGTPEEPLNLLTRLHDFGFRGSTSVESAAIGGLAHLVNFVGSDTIAAMTLAMDYYNTRPDNNEIVAISIPAAEHSTITSWGEENEEAAMKNMLTQYPTGYVACVSDSWNIDRAVSEIWGGELMKDVATRKGTLVVRPDSGHPPMVVTRVINTLMERFGFSVNRKGYRVLPPFIRVIQGDGIDYNMIREIYEALDVERISSDNIAFGSGGALLQKMDRDTFSFAFKCSHVVVDGQGRDVYKRPVTDPLKNSKRGRLVLTEDISGEISTKRLEDVPQDSGYVEHQNLLQEVFRDGRLLVDNTLEQVRGRANLNGRW